MGRNLLLIIILALGLPACNNSGLQEGPEIREIDVIGGYNTPGRLKLSEIAGDVEFVRLEAVPGSFFTAQEWGFVRNISVSRKHILVRTKKSLILFSRNGKFIRNIGRPGKGPGEYAFIETAFLDPLDRFIIAIDPFTDQVLKYSTDGNLLAKRKFSELAKQWDLDFMRLINFDSSHLALMLMRPKRHMENFSQVLCLDHNLNVTDSLMIRPDDNNLILRSWVRGHLAESNGRLLFWENYFDTLWYLHPDGRQVPEYRLRFSKDDIPEDYFNDLSGQTGWNRLCYIDRIVDLPGHLILMGNYDQKELFCLDYVKNTAAISRVTGNEGYMGFENDLYAFPVISEFDVNYTINILYQIMEIAPPGKSGFEIPDAILKKQVLFPQKRDEFIRLVRDWTENDNPLIIIMNMKN